MSSAFFDNSDNQVSLAVGKPKEFLEVDTLIVDQQPKYGSTEKFVYQFNPKIDTYIQGFDDPIIQFCQRYNVKGELNTTKEKMIAHLLKWFSLIMTSKHTHTYAHINNVIQFYRCYHYRKWTLYGHIPFNCRT